jgi:2'-5' RNA ligase
MTSIDEVSTNNEIIAQDWHIFESLTCLTNHWDRPGWPAGRRAYFWYLTFSESAPLRSMAARCQDVLAAKTLDPIPLADLHMTIDPIGPEEEFTSSQISAIGRTARQACQSFPKIDLSIGPLAGSDGAIRFSATPQQPIFELRKLLRSAVTDCVPSTMFTTKEFRPHVGIAYSNSNMPAAPIIRMVKSLRNIPTVPLRVSEASLVLLERRERAWAWTTAERVPFTGE